MQTLSPVCLLLTTRNALLARILGVYLCILICVHCLMMDVAVKRVCFFLPIFYKKKKQKVAKYAPNKCNLLATGQNPSGQCLFHPCSSLTVAQAHLRRSGLCNSGTYGPAGRALLPSACGLPLGF